MRHNFRFFISILVITSLITWCSGPIYAQSNIRDYWGNVCAIDGKYAYRYNKYIIESLYEAVRGLRIAAYASGRAIDIPTQKEAERRLSEIPESDDLRGEGVYQAPVYIDLYHNCSRRQLTVVQDQYLLRYDDTTVRVLGDACSDEPTLLFMDRAWSTPSGPKLSPENFEYAFRALSHQLSYQAQAYIRSDGDLTRTLDLLISGKNATLPFNSVERFILNFLLITDKQCGSIPASIKISVKMPYDSKFKQAFGYSQHADYVELYSGKFVTSGFKFEPDDRNAEKVYAEFGKYVGQRQAQIRNRSNKAQESLAYGVALVAIGLLLSKGPAISTYYTTKALPGGRTQLIRNTLIKQGPP